jgi:hypothetical protein
MKDPTNNYNYNFRSLFNVGIDTMQNPLPILKSAKAFSILTLLTFI